jgi:hypothetical protein
MQEGRGSEAAIQAQVELEALEQQRPRDVELHHALLPLHNHARLLRCRAQLDPVPLQPQRWLDDVGVRRWGGGPRGFGCLLPFPAATIDCRRGWPCFIRRGRRWWLLSCALYGGELAHHGVAVLRHAPRARHEREVVREAGAEGVEVGGEQVLAVELLVVGHVVHALHGVERAGVLEHRSHLAQQLVVVGPSHVPRLALLCHPPAHLLGAL